MIESIQFLRAVAALMVVFFHAYTMVGKFGYGETFTNAGASGVDIFFVISGFVIYIVSAKKDVSPVAFFVRRLIRVAPLYWMYTTITVALLIFVPSVYRNLRFELIPTICSYFFLLSVNNAGGVGTVLGIGWSVAYEMYFYVLFFISMLLMPRASFKFFAVLIVGGALLSLFIKSPAPAFTIVSLSTLPLEFLAGCFIARLYTRGAFLNPYLCGIAIAVGLFGLWYFGSTGKVSSERDVLRVFYFGLPAVLIVYGLVSLDALKLVKFARFSLAIGDASYSIYLCHPFVLEATGKIWGYFSLKTVFPSEVLLMAGILFSIIAGLVSYYVVERPVTRALNSKFGFRKPTNSQNADAANAGQT